MGPNIREIRNLLESVVEYLDIHNTELEGYMDDLAEEINPRLRKLGIREIEIYEEDK